MRADGSRLPVRVIEAPLVDAQGRQTGWMMPGSFHAIARWATMPRPLSIVGDRVYAGSLRTQGLKAVVNPKVTVNYLCTWAVIFQAIGEPVPDYAKSSIDIAPTAQWWRRLDARDRKIVDRLAAARIAF